MFHDKVTHYINNLHIIQNLLYIKQNMDFPGGVNSKKKKKKIPACQCRRHKGSAPGLGRSPGGGHRTHPSILTWRIPWTGEPGRLQAMGSQRVGHE